MPMYHKKPLASRVHRRAKRNKALRQVGPGGDLTVEVLEVPESPEVHESPESPESAP
jgi:hypothetical protein